MVIGEAEDGGDFEGGGDEDDAAWGLVEDSGAIEGIRDEVFVGGEEIIWADDVGEIGEDGVGKRHGVSVGKGCWGCEA